MKYIGNFLAIAVLAISLVACDGKATTESTVQNEEVVDTVMSVVKALEEIDTVSPANVRPCVIDFYATWCGPCKKLAPRIEKMEKKYGDKVLFEKIDVDKNPLLAKDYEIESIPTLIFMKPDGSYDRTVGVMSESELEAKIAALLE